MCSNLGREWLMLVTMRIRQSFTRREVRQWHRQLLDSCEYSSGLVLVRDRLPDFLMSKVSSLDPVCIIWLALLALLNALCEKEFRCHYCQTND